MPFSCKADNNLKKNKGLPAGIFDGLLAVLAGTAGATARNGSDRSTAKQGQGKTFETTFSVFFSSTISFSFPLTSLLILSVCNHRKKKVSKV